MSARHPRLAMAPERAIALYREEVARRAGHLQGERVEAKRIYEAVLEQMPLRRMDGRKLRLRRCACGRTYRPQSPNQQRCLACQRPTHE